MPPETNHSTFHPPPRTKPRWQFSLLALLALTTVVAVSLGLIRIHLLFGIAIAVFAVETLILIGADLFVRSASRGAWSAVTRVAWIAVAILLAAWLALIVFAIRSFV